MWLGIICTCVPILYTFYRTQIIARRNPAQQGAFVAVQDPNSGQAVPRATDDSGYYTGNSTVITMDRIDPERLSSSASHDLGLRAASNKSLLVSVERCDD